VCKSKANDAADDVLAVSAAGASASSNSQDRDKCFSDLRCSVGVERPFYIAAAPGNLGPAVIKTKLKNQLVDDQRPVAFMFGQRNLGKIKNTKIMVWRLELEQLNYSIRHRPGKDNVAPDAMFRICSSVSSVSQLRLLHDQLGHSGFARMYHFIRSRNLPYTSEETKDIIDKCRICLQIKPRFFNPHRDLLLT